MLLNSKWITHKTGGYKSADDKYGNPSPYFRKEFVLSGNVKKAQLYASALGVFKLYINGEAVCDDFLSPGWVDYSKKLPMVCYDVTSLIKDKNAIGAVLGDGWAVGHIGSNYTFKRNGYSDRIEFTSELCIEYDDGHTDNIITDGSWKASDGAIRRSDIYMGEYIDMRLDKGAFSEYGYDDSKWDFAEVPEFKFSRNLYLEKADIPFIKVKHIFKPTLVWQKDNVMLFDVSQNISGVLNCTFVGESGATVVIRHGEVLENGCLYTENLRKAEATDTFVLAGMAQEHFRPLFTYHGFRYAEITINGNAQLTEITAEAMYTDLDASGSFSCSNSLVNQIYNNALWGQRDNFLNVPTDCPQRDERLGWTGDAQIFCKSAMFNMNCKKFYEKYLADIRDAQLGNGVIPAAAPLPHVGSYDYTGREAAAGWCEAIAEIPYNHYLFYGDKGVIYDNLHAVKMLIRYYMNESPDFIRSGKDAYGDWLSLDNTDLSVVSTLYYAKAVYICGKMCEITGDADEKEFYNSLYENIKTAFRNKFVGKDGKILSDTQSAYVIAYSFGIIDAEEAKANLERKFTENNGKLTCGFLGIKFLLPTLCDLGLRNIAYSLITSEEYPGWGYSVVNGATTIWEHWDSYTTTNGIKKGMNSFNHYSFGSCTEWMYEYVLGISPVFGGAGFKKVCFRPYFDLSGRITCASGHYDTAFGRISVSWEKKENTYVYSVEYPECIDVSFDFYGVKTDSEKSEQGKKIFVLSAI